MTNFVLIKGYNPAYRYWIRAQLKQKRIMGEREYSLKEAEQISMDMAARGVDDVFFRRYYWAWREHPEHPPDYFSLLRMVLPIYEDGKPNLATITQLDREARTRNQRILLTIEDAAQDFHSFYENFITKPLVRDLKRGARGKRLITYFEFEEFDRLRMKRGPTQEVTEEDKRTVAIELLQWLQTITPDKVLDDIKQTLAQHYDKGLASANSEHGYNFKSEYIAISAHQASGPEKFVTTFLNPARGYPVVREGYREVFYPSYYVYTS